MSNEIPLTILRQRPAEWRRRGLTPPAELDAIIAARLGERLPVRALPEPSYEDFFAV